MSLTTSFPKSDIRVLLLEGVAPTAVESFRNAGYSNIQLYVQSLPDDLLRQEIAQPHIVGLPPRTFFWSGSARLT